VTQLELGKYEGGSNRCCKVIGNYAFVDKTRIGIFGWSYGVMANSLFKGNDTFKMAIAVAPVTGGFMI
jgi:dipeptidyl-peptidase-4